MNKKYLVTGGEGFIGSYVCQALLNHGGEVHSIDFKPQEMTPRVQEVHYHKGDIRDLALMKKLAKGVDVIFHIAGLPRATDSLSDPRGTLSVNVSGTQTVLDAASFNRVRRVIFASSSAIYGDQTELPLRETMFPLPLSPYGFQKYLGEQLMLQYARDGRCEAVSLRFFNVYGFWTDLSSTGSLAITRFLKARSDKTPITIYGDGSQTRDFVHVEDVARACLSAAKLSSVGAAEVINIASGNAISIKTIAELIGGPVTHLPEFDEIRHSWADITFAQRLLGWHPSIRFEDGLSALKVAWGIE